MTTNDMPNDTPITTQYPYPSPYIIVEPPIYEVAIDFSDASRAWRANKVAIANGMFTYRCNYIHTNTKRCAKPVCASSNKYITHESWTPFVALSSARETDPSCAYCKSHSRLRRITAIA